MNHVAQPAAKDAVAAPPRAGLCLTKTQRDAALAGAPAGEAFWYEIHAEDYLGAAEEEMAALRALAARHPLSVHGTALSIGAERDLDLSHLDRLTALLDDLNPALFSEHLAWSSHDQPHLRDQLPLPYDQATLDRASRHIDQIQGTLGRRMLLENPSTHIRFANSTMAETDFLRAVVERTGCGLLLDATNVVISAATHRYSAEDYLDAFPIEAVGEVHLGGYAEALDAEGRALLPSAEGQATPEPVWTLFERLVERIGPRPTLIEWDGPTPDAEALEREAARANAILARGAA